jgi:hypothetical protein
MELLPRPVPQLVQVSRDQGRGNIVAVRPILRASDYAGALEFAAALNSGLAVAASANILHDNTVVVFPEMCGHFMLFADEWRYIYAQPTFQRAVNSLVANRLPAAGIYKAQGYEWRESAFRAKAAIAATRFGAAMGGLATFHGVTIVAGSIALPGPYVQNGKIEVEPKAPFISISSCWRPNGTCLKTLACKHVVSAFETNELGVVPAGFSAPAVFDTPIGGVSVALGSSLFSSETDGVVAYVRLETSVDGQPSQGSSFITTDEGTAILMGSQGNVYGHRLGGRMVGRTQGVFRQAPTEGPVVLNVWL